jgi:ferredoxin-NADP reductase/Na+-translocating ferredoxin:NAD+ oxidoreductase RnfD subunit
MRAINALLNRFNMYLVVRAYLGALVLLAIGLSWLNILPYQVLNIIGMHVYLVAVCIGANWVLARFFRAETSLDSSLITALILTLILGPLSLAEHWFYLGALAVIAMASKYLLAWHGKHLFNPAAVAVVAASVVFNQGASWWVGTPLLLALIVIGGALLIQKIQRWRLVLIFIGAYMLFILAAGVWMGTVSEFSTAGRIFTLSLTSSPLLFFTFVMLVEPATSPRKKWPQIYFAVGTAALVVVFQYWLGITYAFTLALLVGNVAARLMEPSRRYKLTLDSTIGETEDTMSFRFKKPKDFQYAPGQFMVWSLPHRHPDLRGTRRWFTLSSSPTESELMITMRFSDESSSFKQAIRRMEPGDHMTANGPGGEFTLPEDPDQPLIWLAGGIGITPFRSMAKHLYDTGETRDITLFYGNPSVESIVFKDLFDSVAPTIGLKPVYALTDQTPEGDQYESGIIDADMIKRHAPSYAQAMFFLSGPQPMVESMETMLRGLGIKRDRITTDYFPGYGDEQ